MLELILVKIVPDDICPYALVVCSDRYEHTVKFSDKQIAINYAISLNVPTEVSYTAWGNSEAHDIADSCMAAFRSYEQSVRRFIEGLE
jgi:hypothetical protein